MRKFLDFRVLILILSKGVIISEVRRYFQFFSHHQKHKPYLFSLTLWWKKNFFLRMGLDWKYLQINEERIFAHNCKWNRKLQNFHSIYLKFVFFEKATKFDFWPINLFSLFLPPWIQFWTPVWFSVLEIYSLRSAKS